MADSGFPGRGRHPQREVPTYYLAISYRKLHDNEKKIWAPVPCPLNPSMVCVAWGWGSGVISSEQL